MGTLQVGGTTLGVKNTSTNKVDLSNASIGSDTVFPAGGTGNAISVAVIADEKSSGSDAGSTTANTFQKRTLNTEISDPDGIVSLSNSQFTLGAGTYHIYFQAPNFRGDAHKTAIYDDTGSAFLAFGTNMHSGQNDTSSISSGSVVHSPSGSNVYELQHRCAAAKSSNGFGTSCTFNQVEVYALVIISKLK